MNRDDRKRRFNEAIVNMLYPSPESLPPPQHEGELEPVEDGFIGGSASGRILDDYVYENASTSGNDSSETTGKLTRSQRKKIRKKKLKEQSLHRPKLIGPLFPLTPTHDPPPVRSNAPQQGDVAACAKSVKVKQRRIAKRLAKDKLNASTSQS